ncbi:MAG TPA: M3 family metallopeptidase [Bacteroidaceae bacterium]|nr:M3 family metallopeptidase [Bacteroidaceae bacterium]
MSNKEKNPFFKTRKTPRETVPFDQIKLSHFKPAILEGIKRQNAEIESIIGNSKKPDFNNTILALERSGEFLDSVVTVFKNLHSSHTNNNVELLAEQFIPMLDTHYNSIFQNSALFEKVKEVYEGKHLNMYRSEKKLADQIYLDFTLAGAALDYNDKIKYKNISEKLSMLMLHFSRNKLNETNKYFLEVTDKKDLEGIPENVVNEAITESLKRGSNGWTFTLRAPSYVPFLTYCKNRELRKQIYLAYNTLGANDNEFDNRDIVKKIVNLRLEKAKLLGFSSYAEYKMVKRMAKTTENVMNFLSILKQSYLPNAHKEYDQVAVFASGYEKTKVLLQPWDYLYYCELLKKEQYSIDTEEFRPYLELDRVIDGVFNLANSLFGIKFKENNKIPVYHPDIRAYEVFDHDGAYLAVLYTDFFPRESKRAGAWMSNLKKQWNLDGENSRPHVSITMNFTKPSKGKPSLLTINEVETFLHEFGHALHSIFSDVVYKSQSSPDVLWDFVELPSQIMEYWVTEKKFLNTFAVHYQRGELIPDRLVDNLKKARNFQVAYNCMRQVTFGLLDMAWYARTEPFVGDVVMYDNSIRNSVTPFNIAPGTCLSSQFSHIMSGGYAAGYYSYKWAEVLSADAFCIFERDGLFNRQTGEAFRNKILSKGSSREPISLFRDFRGSMPSITPLLFRNGIESKKNKSRNKNRLTLG